MNKKHEEVFNFIKKFNFPCNPLHAESLEKFNKDELKEILNRLNEEGRIVLNYYSKDKDRVSVKAH